MTLKVVLLGCGGIGARHAEAVTKLPQRMRLVACVGRDTDKTADFAQRFSATPYVDFKRMLDRERPDLLIVTLPPYAHGGEVELAARSGVNLLVEKPIALDMHGAEAMVKAVQESGVTAACGFMYRHGIATRAWDNAKAAGETGAPGHFSGQFHCNALHAPWWRERSKSGGQMVEQLIHIIDLGRHFMGEPQTVYARAANLFHGDTPDYDTEDVSGIILGYDDGRIGVLHASNAAVPGRWAKQWQIVAQRMTGIFADWNTAEFFSTASEVSSETISGERDVFVAQLEDIADAIAEGRQPLVPLADGAASLRIALAARQSADERREITL